VLQYSQPEQPTLEHNNIVGNSPQIRKIFEIIKKIARSNASILITGKPVPGRS
jgi:DNA-binding NtrC family response regulator